LQQPEIAIAEFKRILRPGGEIVIALHNWSALIDYPEDPDLRRRRMRVFSSIADMHLAQKMPSILSAGGFHDVSVEIELDRVYSAIGSIGPEARRNYAEVLEAGIERAVESLGNRSERAGPRQAFAALTRVAGGAWLRSAHLAEGPLGSAGTLR
jgi:hypothetical protein